jgi:hypothetical protein
LGLARGVLVKSANRFRVAMVARRPIDPGSGRLENLKSGRIGSSRVSPPDSSHVATHCQRRISDESAGRVGKSVQSGRGRSTAYRSGVRPSGESQSGRIGSSRVSSPDSSHVATSCRRGTCGDSVGQVGESVHGGDNHGATSRRSLMDRALPGCPTSAYDSSTSNACNDIRLPQCYPSVTSISPAEVLGC